MDAARFQRISDIFETARDLAPGDRGVYLAEACGADTDLRDAVEELLGHHEGSRTFLADPAADHMNPASADAAPPRHPETIGAYRILELLGQGGMGRVYLAEQTEPIRRRVAIKLIKRGMDTRDVVRRFERERRALALMTHPHIAQVLDAGATDAGQPFFVMEHVEGERITDYCDRRALPVAARLRLFVDVCRAVQHAHQRGIIHRDLKPSNILVKETDDAPVPKIIDFGIAKAIRGSEHHTLHTEREPVAGTPAYMSPEQVRGQDVDTRADVYSLGALLHELLAGSTPIEAERIESSGPIELQRLILDAEPSRPSRRLHAAPAAAARALGAQRGTTVTGLRRAVRGDLDWITWKSLAREPADRYATAAALADDLERHLERVPVLASPPGLRHRVTSVWRRHPLGVSTGAVVGIALLVGLTFTIDGFLRASRASAHAQADAKRAQDAEARTRTARREAQSSERRSRVVVELIQSMFSAVDPLYMKGRDYTVEALLDDFDERGWDRVADEPLVELALRETVGLAYEGLGALEEAEHHLDRRLALAIQTRGEDHPRTARARIDLGWLKRIQQKLEPAAELIETARRTLAAQFPEGHRNLVVALYDLGEIAWERDQYEEALTYHRRALAMAEVLFADGFEHANEGLTLSDVYKGVAAALRSLDRYEAAIEPGEERLALIERMVGASHPRYGHALVDHAITLERLNRHDEAIKLARRGCAITKDAAPNTQMAVTATTTLGMILRSAGQSRNAARVLEGAYRDSKRLGFDTCRMGAARGLGAVRVDTGRIKEGRALLEEALALAIKQNGESHTAPDSIRHVLGTALSSLGESDRACAVLEQVVAFREKHYGPRNSKTLQTLNNLAMAQINRGKVEIGMALFEKLARVDRDERGPGRVGLAAMNNLAAMKRRRGKPVEALKLFEEVYRARVKRHGATHPDTLPAMINLGNAYSERGNYKRAIPILESAIAVAKQHLVPGHRQRLAAEKNLAVARYHTGDAERALPAFKSVAEVRRKRFGMDSRRVLKDFAWVASCHARLRQFDDAVRVMERAVAAGRRIDRRKRIDLDYELFLLGGFYLQAGRAADAERILRECQARHDQDRAGPITRAQTEVRLGAALGKLGRDDEAEPLLVKSASILLKSTHTSASVRKATRDFIVAFYTDRKNDAQAAHWRTAHRRTKPPASR